MEEAYALVGVGLSVFAFALILLALGTYAGGNWEAISQGISVFLMIVVGFFFAAYVLKNVMEKW